MRWKGEATRLPPFSLWEPFDTMTHLDYRLWHGGIYCEKSCRTEASGR